MSRRIFIGDVHGHFDGLMQLLDTMAIAEDDHLYFVGDLIDRGPCSAQVVDYVFKSRHTCVLGNHEQLLLNALSHQPPSGHSLQGWLYSGGQATLTSYNDNMDLLAEHAEWMRSLPLYIDLTDIWLVHAGVNPALKVSEQTAEECCWVRDVFHSGPEPYFSDKLIVTGHTITFTFPDVAAGQIVEGPGWLDIDTGAYHPRSGWLTGLDIDNELVYQVNVFDEAHRTRRLQDACSPFTRSRGKALVNTQPR